MTGRSQHRRRGVWLAAVAAALLAACGTSVTGDDAAATDHPRPLDVGTVEPAADPPRAWTTLDVAERTVQLDVVAGGDLLVHRAVWESASRYAGGEGFDFGPVFEPVRSYVAGADLALCHLEVPLSADSTDLSSFPRFNAPFELADAIAAAGFDGCSVASNHTLDQGTDGIDATLGHLDRVGVGHAGAARSPEEAITTRTYESRGRVVAHLSYAYGFNGFRIPDEEPWRTNLIDPARILDDARRARHDGAHLVIVSLHFGTEYEWAPSAYQRDVVEAVTAGPEVDLVVGHHAHVVQPVATVGDTPVLYGLGNLLSNMHQPERRDGVLVRVSFELVPGEAARTIAVEALPTEVGADDHRIAAASPTSWERTMDVLNRGGTAVSPADPPSRP